MALICWIFDVCSLRAGHDLMVPLAVYNDGIFGVEAVPAVFGIPLPSSEDPVDLEDLILVGAESFQLRPLSYWPNGSMRWIFVEAIVNVPPQEDRAALHLTTGQAVAALPKVGSKIADGYFLDTGSMRAKILLGERILCQVESVEDQGLPAFSMHLSSDGKELGALHSREVFMEINGPVTATLRLVETYSHPGGNLTFTRRCRAFRGQAGLMVESVLHLSAATDLSSSEGMLPIHFPTLSLQPGNSWQEAGEKTSGRGGKHFVSGDQSVRILQMQESRQGISEMIEMRPGMLVRQMHAVDLSTGKDSYAMLDPLVGRAISVHAYNDARCLERPLLAGKGEERVDLQAADISSQKAARYLHAIMGGDILPRPVTMMAMRRWLSNLTGKGFPETVVPDHALGEIHPYSHDASFIFSLWFFLTGDEAFRERGLDWAEHLEPDDTLTGDVAFGLWNAYLLSSSIEPRDTMLAGLGPLMDAGLHQEKNLLPLGNHTLPLMGDVLRQGGLEPALHDRWLDRMESLIHLGRDTFPSDLLYAEGYRLTGETSLLKEGKQWLQRDGAEILPNNAVTGMVKGIHRQYTWHWLPIKVDELAVGDWRLTWQVPRGTVRYRVKHSDQPITNLPEQSSIAFHRARDLDYTISMQPAGTSQNLMLSSDMVGDSRHFAMRYLERGPDLPAPRSMLPPEEASALEESQTASPWQVVALSLLLLIVISFACAFLIKRKRI